MLNKAFNFLLITTVHWHTVSHVYLFQICPVVLVSIIHNPVQDRIWFSLYLLSIHLGELCGVCRKSTNSLFTQLMRDFYNSFQKHHMIALRQQHEKFYNAGRLDNFLLNKL